MSENTAAVNGHHGGARIPTVLDQDEAIEQVGQSDRSLAVAGTGNALEAITRGEVDMLVATAHRYPRSVTLALREVETLATMDEETAESCFYLLKRGGKEISGPSIRLAELFSACWGNLRVGARIIEEGERFIIAQGVAIDLQKNNYASIEVQRRITDKNGKRYNDDMIGVTAAAAQAIARRNAIFGVIPRTYVNRVYNKARAVAVGDATTLVSKRQKWFEWLAKRGVDKARALAGMGLAGEEDVTLDHLERLIGIATAIKDGQTTIEAAFPVVPAAGAAPAAGPVATTVAQKVAEVAAKKAAEEKPTAKVEEPPPHDPQTGEVREPGADDGEAVDTEALLSWEAKLVKVKTKHQAEYVAGEIEKLPPSAPRDALLARARTRLAELSK